MKFFDKVRDVFAPGDYDDDDEYDDYEDTETVKESGSGKYSGGYAPTNNSNVHNFSSQSNSSYYSGSSGSSGSLGGYGSTKRTASENRSNVVNINTNVKMQVCIFMPDVFEDVKEICDQLKLRKSVVVNLEKVAYPDSQRIMDFIGGTVHSLDGNLKRISNKIFIIVPDSVGISGDIKEELKSNGVFLDWGDE